jgi:hypothetical protein
VPIRKFLILYQIYLRYLFGKVATEGDIESEGCGEFKDLKYLKAYVEKLMPDSEQARFYVVSKHPVEQFYKRNMNAENPIP